MYNSQLKSFYLKTLFEIIGIITVLYLFAVFKQLNNRARGLVRRESDPVTKLLHRERWPNEKLNRI